jgi:Domain of unknown function (DUF4928)
MILYHGSNSCFTYFSKEAGDYSDNLVCLSAYPIVAACYGKYLYACEIETKRDKVISSAEWASITPRIHSRCCFIGDFHDSSIWDFYAVSPVEKIIIQNRINNQRAFDFRDITESIAKHFSFDRVRDFFAGKPFKFRVDASLSIRAAVRDLLLQARARQAEFPGSRYEGAVLQHLIGAKLELVLPANSINHHSASEADQAEGRAGDFVIGDVAIHATTHPGEALIRKCAANISAGLRPIIVTVPKQTAVADGLAEAADILDKLEVLDIEQFLASNLHERAFFQTKNRSAKTIELLTHYNRLIDSHETDPSLKINIAGK